MLNIKFIFYKNIKRFILNAIGMLKYYNKSKY